MAKFLDFLLIMITGFLILTLFTSCGTTSTMRCDRYIGPEKEECVTKTELIQRQRLNRIDRAMDREMGRRKY